MAPFDRNFRHLPFFEALAGMEEGSAEWRAATGGLVVLRLVDAWFAEGAQVAAADGWSAKVAREAVEAMDAGTPARALLLSTLDSMLRTALPRGSAIAPQLAAYGRALNFDGKWRLAADVYETLLEHSHPIDDADMYIHASMQIGWCSRMTGSWERAQEAYDEAGQVATAVGDVVGILRARIANARLDRARGNLPRAEELLDGAIHSARAEALVDVEALALHERGMVGYDRGRFEETIRYGYEALGKYNGQSDRDRVLGDIATAFMELGVLTTARDAFLVLAATAQEQYARWTASMNLMELSAMEGIEPAFESYRRKLEAADFPAPLRAEYHVAVAKGLVCFGRIDQARATYTRAMELAAELRLNRLYFSAEESLRQLEAGIAAAERAASASAPLEIADVAEAIHSMRELAGVGE